MFHVSESRRFPSIRLVWDGRTGRRLRNRTVGEAIAVAVAIGKPIGVMVGHVVLAVVDGDGARRCVIGSAGDVRAVMGPG